VKNGGVVGCAAASLHGNVLKERTRYQNYKPQLKGGKKPWTNIFFLEKLLKPVVKIRRESPRKLEEIWVRGGSCHVYGGRGFPKERKSSGAKKKKSNSKGWLRGNRKFLVWGGPKGIVGRKKRGFRPEN